jgi:hypothetical protein
MIGRSCLFQTGKEIWLSNADKVAANEGGWTTPYILKKAKMGCFATVADKWQEHLSLA